MPPDFKALIASKTFWFNVLAFVILIANVFGFANFIPDERTAEYGGIVVTLVNVLLRLATRTRIQGLL